MKAPKPGYYRDVSKAEYNSWDAIRQSDLKKAKRTLAHYRTNLVQPPEPTKALAVGDAFDAAALDPVRFKEDYIHGLVDADGNHVRRQGKANLAAWEAWEQKHKGKIMLDKPDYDMALGLREAVWKNPLAKALLGGKGYNHLALVWEDRATGLLCKAQIDRYTRFEGRIIIVDLKSTVDASGVGFGIQAHKFGYHNQGAWYVDGARAVLEKELPFVLLAVEKEKPYCVAAYELPDSAIDQGRAENEALLYRIAEARKSNQWPGYPSSIQPLMLPKWAFYDVETWGIE